jgi:hypothetical protein
MGNPRQHTVSVSATIAADADRVYGIIADYRNGHPRILPPQFSKLTVEKGGVGAGTVITFKMRLFGRTQNFRAMVTEPEPGRVLVETNCDRYESVSTFTVDPIDGSHSSRVTISTELQTHGGIAGTIERGLVTWVLRPIYRRELELLAALAERWQKLSAAGAMQPRSA